MGPDSRDYGAVNVVDGIGATSILGKTHVVVIRNVAHRVEHHILEHGTKANGIPDLGLIFLCQVDALGVTAALKIKDSSGTPSVLVIADQEALRVCGKRGLARAGQ